MGAKPILVAVLALVGFPLFAEDVMGGSWVAPTSELAAYKLYTHRLVTPLWQREMKINEVDLRYSECKIRCTIHSDGSISDLTIVTGEYSGMLRTVSTNVLLAAAPFKPFSATMLKEDGLSYIDTFTFTVTRSHARPDSLIHQPMPPGPAD